MNNYISACQRDFPVHPSLHVSIYILIHPQVTCTQEKKIVQGYLPYASVAYQVSTFTY